MQQQSRAEDIISELFQGRGLAYIERAGFAQKVSISSQFEGHEIDVRRLYCDGFYIVVGYAFDVEAFEQKLGLEIEVRDEKGNIYTPTRTGTYRQHTNAFVAGIVFL